MATLRQWLLSAVETLKGHKRAYLVINIAYYGLVAAAMVYVTSHPELQEALLGEVALSLTQGPLSGVAEAYAAGRPLEAMLLTFVFNFFLGSLVVLVAPSLILPFAGVGIGFVRAVLWGLLLAPTTPALQAAMIPHSLTLILEGQGYILAMMAAWVMGRAFITPSSVGASSWTDGYVRGLKDTGRLLLLVAIVLGVAAVYEALEVIYLVPRLLPQGA